EPERAEPDGAGSGPQREPHCVQPAAGAGAGGAPRPNGCGAEASAGASCGMGNAQRDAGAGGDAAARRVGRAERPRRGAFAARGATRGRDSGCRRGDRGAAATRVGGRRKFAAVARRAETGGRSAGAPNRSGAKTETNEHEMLETSMRARDDADRVAHELEAVTEQLGALKQNAAELQAKIGGLREQRDGLTK